MIYEVLFFVSWIYLCIIMYTWYLKIPYINKKMEKTLKTGAWILYMIRFHKLIHPILYILHRIYFFFTTQPIPLASESKGIVQKRLAYQALGRLFRGQSPYHTMILNQKFTSKSGPCAKNSQHPIWFFIFGDNCLWILQLLNYEVVCYSHEKSHWFFHVKFWRSKARSIF
jgi:hypothetical protein